VSDVASRLAVVQELEKHQQQQFAMIVVSLQKEPTSYRRVTTCSAIPIAEGRPGKGNWTRTRLRRYLRLWRPTEGEHRASTEPNELDWVVEVRRWPRSLEEGAREPVSVFAVVLTAWLRAANGNPKP